MSQTTADLQLLFVSTGQAMVLWLALTQITSSLAHRNHRCPGNSGMTSYYRWTLRRTKIIVSKLKAAGVTDKSAFICAVLSPAFLH
jgi:hypothetical protein